MRDAYDELVGVYEWLVPDELLSPEGAVAPFAAVTAALAGGARVLDCACGIGRLAVGLARRGFAVTATDASPAMVMRTCELAAEHGVTVDAAVRRWDELGEAGWSERFDAVFCVGNALVHAEGRRARRDALRNMASVLRPGAPLAVTSRNWELERRHGSRLELPDRLVERGGVRGLVVHRWAMAAGWEREHRLDVAVVLVGDDGRLTTRRESLAFWPFRHETLHEDLVAAGLAPESTTYRPDTERYAVVARKPERGRPGRRPAPAA